MTLLKTIGQKLPVLRKNQTCEACGESFACEISLSTGCWCSEVKVSESARQELRAKYSGCLCRGCLEETEARHANFEEQKEV